MGHVSDHVSLTSSVEVVFSLVLNLNDVVDFGDYRGKQSLVNCLSERVAGVKRLRFWLWIEMNVIICHMITL